MIDYRVYLVTDDPSRYSGNWLDNVVAAVEGGVTCVQYRDTESDGEKQYERLRALRDAIGKTPIIVNNDATLARAVKAEGVHVGQGDMPPPRVREIVGPQCEIGFSITDLSQVPELERLAALPSRPVDLIGIGPVYDARKTKIDAAQEMGLEGLSAIVARTSGLVNCAIGGITLERAPGILSVGAQGLAIVSAFSKSDDPFAVARDFRRLFT